MLRFDDNTFIDNSLITCAEYQLFLDDVRAEGKCLQPDHWLKWQFSVGQAHKPLLGMRPSDAVEFCRWLTAREQGGWVYRLPTPEESAAYPLPAEASGDIGYWTITPSSQNVTFVWASAHTPKKLAMESLRSRIEVELATDRDFARDVGTPGALDHTIDFDRALALNLDYDLSRGRANDLPVDLNHALGQDQGLVEDLKQFKDIELDLRPEHDSMLVLPFNLDLDKARQIGQGLVHDLARTIELDFDLDRDIERTLDRANRPDYVRARGLAHARIRDMSRVRSTVSYQLRDQIRARASDVVPTPTRGHIRELARERIRELDRERTRINRRAKGRTPDQIIDKTLDQALSRNVNYIVVPAYERALERALQYALDLALDRAFSLYIDLLVLGERRQGRLPPHEGIRIVKELAKEIGQ